MIILDNVLSPNHRRPTMNTMHSNSVKPSQAVAILLAAIKQTLPVFLWGAPGLGKSSIVKQVADSLSMGLIDIRAALLDPVDLMGVPSVRDGETRWNVPSWLPKSGKGVLFLDELSNASDAVQNALLQLVLDRRLGDYVMPEGWVIVAAGNRITDGTFSRKLSKALGSRFATHLEVVADLEDWCKWAVTDGQIAAEVVGFVRLRPDLLHQFDPKAQGNSFPCPRTWEMTSRFVGQLPKELELAFFSGTLGDGAAAEFTSFLRIYRDLPNLDAAMLDPDSFTAPTNPSVLYAICGAMSRKTSPDNSSRAFKVMEKLPVEFQVVWLRDTIRATPALCSSKEFTAWVVKHGDLLS
jgi:hypothetical protein